MGGVTLEEVRAFALELPRAYEALVRGRVKFRVGRIVFVAFSRDETLMGFGFPKEFREAAIDVDEMHELVLDAWAMCVPKGVAAAYAKSHPPPAD